MKTVSTFVPTSENLQILDFSKHSDNNVIFAGPGCGKTTQGTQLLIKLKELNPSAKALYCAFNKESALDIEKKVSQAGLQGIKCSTIHALGYNLTKEILATIDKFGKAPAMAMDNYKISNELQNYFKNRGIDTTDFHFQKMVSCINLMKEYLISDAYYVNAKANLEIESGIEYLSDFFEYYNKSRITKLNNGLYWNGFKKISGFHYKFDFTDTLYLTYLMSQENGFEPTEKYDFIIVDEFQDVSPLKDYVINLFGKTGTTFFRIGDLNQSINQFAGATTTAFENAISKSNCYQLTKTFRISKEVVSFINNEFPNIPLVAGETNKTGYVSYNEPKESVLELATNAIQNKETLALISVKNADLMEYAIKFITNDIPFVIRGNDIKGNVLSIISETKNEKETYDKIQKMKVGSVYKKLKTAYPEKDIKQLQKMSEYRVASEPFQIIEALMNHYATTNFIQIKGLVEKIFIGENKSTENITLLTAHKSKGLEFDNVAIINKSDFYAESDKQSEIDKEMQKNLRFVAYSRTKNGLIFLEESTKDEK